MKRIQILMYIISIVGNTYMSQRSSVFRGMNITSSQFASMRPFLLWETNGPSNQVCAVRCLQKPACFSFMRDESSNLCSMFSIDVNVTSEVAFSSLQIYQKQKTCEDRGYISLHSRKKCIKLRYTQLSWIEANKTCASIGENILRITTEEMFHDVVQSVSQTDAAFNYYFIDGNDIEVENNWGFSDGTPLSFQLFEDLEPNGSTGENCLVIANAKYHDTKCSTYLAKFICENNNWRIF